MEGSPLAPENQPRIKMQMKCYKHILKNAFIQAFCLLTYKHTSNYLHNFHMMWISTYDSYVMDKRLQTMPLSSEHLFDFNTTVSFDRNITYHLNNI